MSNRYQLRYSVAFDRDLDDVSPYDATVIRAAVLLLRDQAEVPTRSRRPLTSPVSWCPDASWQLRVRDYRVLYRVQMGLVSLLRVTFKGRKTTEEMGR
jgi:mRNA-degrading endonuclease RelE of RelBE toxin-antitoxin system